MYCHDLKKALTDVIEGRGVVRPHINICIDGGGNKVIFVVQIFDLSELDEADGDDLDEDGNKKDLFKSLGAKRSLVIARGDFAYESRDNLELIYRKLKIYETMQHFDSWHQIGDCKLQNSTTGVSIGFNSRHACYICTSYKDPETELWTSEWDLRTTFTAMVDHNGYDAGGRNKRLMKHNHNQVRDPLILTRDLHQPLWKKFKPDPFHIVKIGVQNDVITNLQKAFPEVVGSWLTHLKQRRDRAGMPGLVSV